MVDDEQDLLILLRKVMAKNCGCEVSVAQSGQEAMDPLKTWRPDVIPSDLLSPEVLAEAEPGRPGIAVPVCVHRLPYKGAKEDVVTHFTSQYLISALTQSSGNVSAAGPGSAMERQTFQRLMRRCQIQSQDYRQDAS